MGGPVSAGDLAVDAVQGIQPAIDVVQQLRQLLVVDLGVLLKRLQAGGMPFQFLHDLGLEIGVAEDGEDFQDAVQGRTAVPVGIALDVVRGLFEEIFQPEESTDALV